MRAIYKFLQLASAIALIGGTSACTNDVLENSSVNSNRQPVTIQASVPEGNSRIAYNEEAGRMNLTWQEDDTLKVVNLSSTSYLTNFNLTEGAGTAFGQFQGTPTTAYNDGDKLFALYYNNMVQANVNSEGNVELSLAEQDGTLNDDYQLMFGETTYKTGQGMQGVELKSLITILKVVIPTNRTLTKLTFNNTHNFHTIGTLVLQNSPTDSEWTFQTGDIAYSKTNLGVDNNQDLSVEGTFTPDAKGNVTIYYYLLRGRGYWGDNNEPDQLSISPNFKVYDSEGNEYVSTNNFGYKVVEEDKMYRLQAEILKVEEFEGEGSVEKPYLISTPNQLYTFMWRCHNNESGENGMFQNLCYKMTNDITLDGSVRWRAFDFNGIFDGGGYTISGTRENTMFGNLFSNAIVRNLKLNVNIVPFDYGYTYFGPLAIAVDGGQVINCMNMADFSICCPETGGLVGAMYNGAKMIGCANTGSINADSYMIGGLVAELNAEATIECCYSTGNITFTGGYIEEGHDYRIGGLVAAMNASYSGDRTGATMFGCWTNITISGIESNGESILVNDIVNNGNEEFDWFSCYKVESIPFDSQITAMNAVMTNTMYQFNTDGTITEKSKPSTTLPEIEVEDF